MSRYRNKSFCLLPGLLLLYWVSASVIAEQRYGRLFTTPEQRTHLDLLRDRFAPNKETRIIAIDSKKRKENANKKRAPSMSILGVMSRSNGESSVWVDSVILNTKQQFEQGIILQQNKDGALSVRVNKGDTVNPVEVKPGQTILWKSGEIIEAYRAKPNHDAQKKKQ